MSECSTSELHPAPQILETGSYLVTLHVGNNDNYLVGSSNNWKEGNILFKDAFNIFYLWLYSADIGK